MLPSELRSALDEADREHTIPLLPGWMGTRLGQWLARRRWLPFGRIWRLEIKLAQLRELDAREMAAACDAMSAIQLWAEADFSAVLDEPRRHLLIGAWCKWRTWHERKAQELGCTPMGSPEWIEKQRPLRESLQ